MLSENGSTKGQKKNTLEEILRMIKNHRKNTKIIKNMNLSFYNYDYDSYFKEKLNNNYQLFLEQARLVERKLVQFSRAPILSP
jgi:hypothetical protein